MLPVPLRLLIAAYAADDLSPRQKKAAVRLLKHSQEARHLLRGIVADGRRLRELPTQRLGDDFADRLLARLPEIPDETRPAVRATASPNRNFSRAHVLAAFSVAIAVGLSTWSVVVKMAEHGQRGVPVIAEKSRPETVVAVKPPQPADDTNDPFEPRQPEIDPPTKRTPEENPAPQPKVVSPAPPRDVLTAPAIPRLEAVQVKPPRLTLVLPAHGLDAKDSVSKLSTDFALGDAHRIDLFCRDTTRALERLQPAVRDKGVRIAIETVAADVAKRRVVGQTYVLFCEDLTPAEWVAIFRHIGAIDRRAEAKKVGDGVYDTLALMPLAQTDHKDLFGLLGVDVAQPSAKTKPADKAAIVLAASAARASPSTSREIKLFLEGRGDRPAGAIAMMLVMRQAN